MKKKVIEYFQDEPWISEYLIHIREHGLREYDINGNLFNQIAKVLGFSGEHELMAELDKPEIYQALLKMYDY